MGFRREREWLNGRVQIARADVVATAKFCFLLGFLIVLPDEELDFLYGLNPRLVWWVVVFISGFSFLGYVLTKIVGPEKGVGVTGFLGGCIASTPTVVSMTEKAKRNPDVEPLYAFGAILVSIAMIDKMFTIIVVVTPHLALTVVVSFLGMRIIGVLFALLTLKRFKATKSPSIELDSDFGVTSALAFGTAVAIILIGINLFDVSVPQTYAEMGAVTAVLVNIWLC